MTWWKDPPARLTLFFGLGATFGLGLGTGFAVDRLTLSPTRESSFPVRVRSLASDPVSAARESTSTERDCVVLKELPLSELRREVGRRTRYRGAEDWIADRFSVHNKTPSAKPLEETKWERVRSLLQGSQDSKKYWKADLNLPDASGALVPGSLYLEIIEDGQGASTKAPRVRVASEYLCQRSGQRLPVAEISVRAQDDQVLLPLIFETAALRDCFPAGLISLPTRYSEEAHAELFDVDADRWTAVPQVFFWIPLSERDAFEWSSKLCPGP